jgi:Ni,Fe-hydrogenase III large subunit
MGVGECVRQCILIRTKILTTQVSITGGRLHLEHTILDGEERDIEGTATEIEDEHLRQVEQDRQQSIVSHCGDRSSTRRRSVCEDDGRSDPYPSSSTRYRDHTQ